MRGRLHPPTFPAFRLWPLLSLLALGTLTGVAYTAGRPAETGVELVPIVTHGLQLPLFVTHGADGSGHLFVVEQPGLIRVIDDGVLREAPFLDLRDRVWTKGNEQGLLGLAFHPEHRRNGRFFVNYNRRTVLTPVVVHKEPAVDAMLRMKSQA